MDEKIIHRKHYKAILCKKNTRDTPLSASAYPNTESKPQPPANQPTTKHTASTYVRTLHYAHLHSSYVILSSVMQLTLDLFAHFTVYSSKRIH